MLPGEALRSRARSSLMARLSSPLSSARPPFPATPSPRAPAQAAASSAARPGGGARRGGCLLPAQPHAAATGRRRGRHRGSGAGRGGGARSSWAPAGRVAAAEAAPQAPPCLGRPPGEGGVRCRKQPGLGQIYSRSVNSEQHSTCLHWLKSIWTVRHTHITLRAVRLLMQHVRILEAGTALKRCCLQTTILQS
ncbi:translation initiation factor IF-2-like isoform X2 [Aquila chrysaetos chrysaetos]|uniref:translation initiation factor IF-2-like isoform X2 n=1 Tax=Aquila chrysaetos chrysaetos TaxID=223781 RepID=UPI001B7D4405|nr:translation initiation factor IF-2-like isoform X2 [Aquila chrysaetos chrysaetos]